MVRVMSTYIRNSNKKAPDGPRSIMSVQQGADFTTLSVRTLYGKMETGELPFFKVGRRTLLKRSDLEALLK